eukprot:s907_g5.t1
MRELQKSSATAAVFGPKRLDCRSQLPQDGMTLPLTTLTLAALCTFAQHWGEDRWRRQDKDKHWVAEMPQLYLTARSVRFLPNVQCALGDRLVEVFTEATGWWVHQGMRISFDVFFDDLAARGGWNLAVLVHFAWLGTVGSGGDGEDNGDENNEGEEEDEDDDDPDVTSLFGSEDHRALNEFIEEVTTVATRPGRGHAEWFEPFNGCFRRIFDEAALLWQVAMCSKSVVYGTKKLKGGKEQVKVEMSSTIIPGFSFNCFFDHTVDRKGHSMIWSLDYDRRSDVDDIKGMWYVAPHPTKEGWSRVYYQIDMRLRYRVPGVLYRALSRSSLSSAVSWVKDCSEKRAEKRR